MEKTKVALFASGAKQEETVRKREEVRGAYLKECYWPGRDVLVSSRDHRRGETNRQTASCIDNTTHTNSMRFTALLRQASAAAGTAGKSPVLIRSASGNPTGITGILQHPNPRPALISLYKATLTELSEKFPADSIYRQSVENLTKSRLAIVESNEVVEKIENQIGCGLIEEVVIQANEELELAKKMAEWKAWEPLHEKPLDDQWSYFGRKV